MGRDGQTAGGGGLRLSAPAGTVTVLSLLICLSVVAVALSGPPVETVTASGQSELEPPELDRGERINDTAVRLVFSDDTGINLSSIQPSDFLLSAGTIDGITKQTAGSEAFVDLRLAEPINRNELTVAVREGSNIQDVDGNRLSTTGFVGVVVDGMDGVGPSVDLMEVPQRASKTARIELDFDEPVASFQLALSGPRNRQLDTSDFQRIKSDQYVLNYQPPEDGVYVFELQSATDERGNTATFARTASMQVQTRSVRAIAGIDLSASEGLNLTFDASKSTDEAVAYVWTFGDGTSAAGKRVTHQFTPGNYTVSLKVVDEFGNVGRDQLVLNLTAGGVAGFLRRDGAGRSAVAVEQSGSPPHSAQVVISNPAVNQPQLIRTRAANRSLVKAGGFSLQEMTVTPSQRGTIAIGLSAVGPTSEALSEASSVTGGRPVGGFVARPTVSEQSISAVTVRFSVTNARLQQLGATPKTVRLYRNTGGSWKPQPTTVQSAGKTQVSFESEFSGFSTFAVLALVNDTDSSSGDDDQQDSGEQQSDGQQSDRQQNGSQQNANSTNETATNTTAGNSSSTDSTAQTSGSGGTFTVTNVTLNTTSIKQGEAVAVKAVVKNKGKKAGDFLAGLAVNGKVVETKKAIKVPPKGGTLPVTFTRKINESGTVTISVNGTSASKLTVGGGGGGLFGFLGFLPLGLLRTFVLFILLPVGGLALLLKAVASYMGY